MKTGMLYMLVFIVVAVLFATLVHGKTVDDTMNEDEIPVLAFSEAFKKAEAELGDNTEEFVCTLGTSKKRKYGGGWGFIFSSAKTIPRYIVINEKGVVTHNKDTGTTKPDLQKEPSISISKAIEVAEQKKRYTTIGAVWIPQKDVWQFSLLDAEKKNLIVMVDRKGKLVEEDESQQKNALDKK